MIEIGERVLCDRTIHYRRENHASLRIHYVQFRHGAIELDAYLQQGKQRWRIHNATVHTAKQATDLLNEWMAEASALGFHCVTTFKPKEKENV